MPNPKPLNSLIIRGISWLLLGILLVSCSTQANIPAEPNSSPTQQKTQEVVQPDNKISCPVIASRNWQAWVERVAGEEPHLNISGEVDLPSPGYQVAWKRGILNRSHPPIQNIAISLIPPEEIVIQVITPTKVSFRLPSPILQYRSVAIYCGNKLLVDLSDVRVDS